MSTSSTVDGQPVLSMEVRCGGQPLPEAVQLLSVRVRRALGSVASARLELRTGDGSLDDGAYADADTFKPGVQVCIAAGAGDAPLALVFDGVVSSLGLRITATDGAWLVVECRDDAAGVPAAAGSGDDLVSSARPVLAVQCGVNLVELQADLSTESPAHGLQPSRRPAFRARGRMVFQGTSRALPGQRVSLAGVGLHFSGEVSLTAIEHRMADGNWLTEAEFGPVDAD